MDEAGGVDPQVSAGGPDKVSTLELESAEARFDSIRVIITGGVQSANLVILRRWVSIESVVGLVFIARVSI
ncbi:MAG: hypothetical protein WCS87_06390 [Methylococcaceae bacterium]